MRIIRIVINIILNVCTYLIKRNNKWIAFGSWCGQSYIDNPRYIYEYLMENTNIYKLIWIGNKEIRQDIPQNNRTLFIRKNSLKSIYYLLKCKYMFVSQSAQADLCSFNVYRNAIITHCWHGVPVKKIGLDMPGYKLVRNQNSSLIKKIRKMLGYNIKYSYFVSSSPKNDYIFQRAFKHIGASKNNILHSGYPRNDMFFNVKQNEVNKIKLKYSKLLEFSMDKKIILYLPTYRRKQPKVESICNRDEAEINMLSNILKKHNAIIIEKNHFQTYVKMSGCQDKTFSDLFIKLTKDHKVNIQEILLFTDILISDYSGAFLDFCLLDRPIIHYAYDYEHYKNVDSGLYYDIEEFAAGKVATTFEEIVAELDNLLSGVDNYSEKRKKVRKEFMTYEQGHASEYICEKVLK